MGIARRIRRPAVAAALLTAAVVPASASSILDDYYGGYNTYTGSNAGTGPGFQIYAGDIIGDPAVFDITGASLQRTGTNGSILQFTIYTNYAGKGGTDYTYYGSLFFTPGKSAWNPTQDPSGHYATDQYKTGEWTYAATMPSSTSDSSGTGGVYKVVDPVVMSNMFGNTTTYPVDPNAGYFFRQGQAVAYDPKGANSLYDESWKIETGKIIFSITDNGDLGNDFAISWAMTCANDIIQGQLNTSQVGSVPEPSTWAMMMLGFAGLGFTAWRRRVAKPQPV